MTATPYQTLVESAAQLTDVDSLVDIDEGQVAAALILVQRNQPALESARRVLGPKCGVTVRYEEAFFSEQCDSISHLRNLARVFHAEAYLATFRADFLTATRISLDILELANAVRRGGLLIDLLASIGISGIALGALCKIRTQLDNRTRRLVIDELYRLETQREPFAASIARDRDWEVAVGYKDKPCKVIVPHELSDPKECGLSGVEQMEILQLVQQVANLPEADRHKVQWDSDCHVLALMRLLSVDLALRAYRENCGRFPDELLSLTPHAVSRIPTDPYTNRPFIYRQLGVDSFCLYSTGPKRTDGGGHFGPWPSVAAGCADLCLDADDYWQDYFGQRPPLGWAQRFASWLPGLRHACRM